MKVIGNVNKLSPEALKRIKPFTRGQQVHYRLLTGVYDVNAEENRFGSQVSFPLRDVIFDEGTGQPVEIAVVKEYKDGVVTRAKKFTIAPIGENMLNNGVFTLQLDNIEHQQIYKFFELCNFNKSNTERDQSIIPIIARIDEEAEAQAEEKTIDVLTDALVRVANMSANEIRTFAAGKNWNLKEAPAVLRNRVKKYAKENPEDFVKASDDPQEKMKVVIKQALDATVISYQPHEHKIVWADGKTLAILDKPENGESEVELFAAWLNASKNGEAILKGINNRLRKAE